MKIFISWSGDLSKSIGDILRRWLPSVTQSVEPYFTPSDIEKGSRWSHSIGRELDQSSIGIFCMTQYNLRSDWILFEAGAISKTIDESQVCPLLFNVHPGELASPMQQFQATRFTKEDMRKLLTTINCASQPGQLTESTLDAAFEKWWPDLETAIKKVLTEYRPESPPNKKTDHELLAEILQIVRYTDVQSASLPIVRLSRDPKRVYTYGTLPNAASNQLEICFVVDSPPDGEYGVWFSNGKTWRRLQDVELVD